ncbi:hypothetical protein HHI36_013232 [Cryptolaemus montrouzieri]|uniref:Uncharacterized protein n=1 Tax=Cryptolaemus montrouzieri TaxID=559131 RepID=A0ABD2NGR3_9CUCU
MEENLNEQSLFADSIRKLLLNKKKDPPSHVTNLIWNNFKSNHAEIEVKLDPTHNNSTKDFYRQVEKTYDETAEYIQKCQVNAAGQNDSTNIEDEADLIPDFIKHRYVKINLFNKAINDISLQLNSESAPWY